ncbi:hypothetical protein CBR_g34338 [Chara braunii]|uniref:Integrase catalytic domain-containing protein n=1 Tax=Chara braunii TaxID=69332 RepID=A0A388LIB6_CHABU|nr:hypothetical protein CBR_g34338 [Chara braunii]|eukprot:GBG82058.1 hypothetical protein CBR_g34338 [Chara braunii]
MRPPTPSGHDAILVVVDRFTKRARFVPCRYAINAREVVDIVFDRVVRDHGLPLSIISDCDPRFTSRFWPRLHEVYSTQLHFSLSYHPQTDGLTEVTNRTLENILRKIIRDDQQWDLHLAHAEIAYNHAVSPATGMSPYYCDLGYHPRVPADFLRPSQMHPDTSCPALDDWVAHMMSIMKTAHEHIAASQTRMAARANRSRMDHSFKVSDDVFIDARHLQLEADTLRKFRRRFFGPCRILQAVGSDTASSPVSFRVKLPNYLRQARVHDVYHVSLLRPYRRPSERFAGRPYERPGQRPRTDEAKRDEIQDILDEQEGGQGGVGEAGRDDAVGGPDLPGEEVVMTSRGVGAAGNAARASRPELDRARREKRKVGEEDVDVRDTTREKRARQTTIEEMYDKEKLAEFSDEWLQWIYAKGLPFNAFRGSEFQRVRRVAERVPRTVRFLFPSYRVTAGARIRSQRTKVAPMPLVNFLAGGANGTLLYATVTRDGSVRDTADVVYRRWRTIILSFPAKDVIGFCTDSTSNYMTAARRFATDPDADIRRITWLPCSTHVCNLMLSDVGTRVGWVKETIICARALVRFIKSHGAAHALFRRMSPRVMLVEPVETRLASVFLMLTCLKGRRDALESMLHGDAWARIPWEHRLLAQAQWVQQQIRDGEFWRCVDCAIRVMAPVHQLLRRMDRGGMMMSIVYEWSQHLLDLMRRVDVPANMVEPCVREVAIRNLHMLEPAHAATHLLNPCRRSLRYYESLQTTSDDAHVVEECDRFLLAQTGGDPVGRLYRTVRDQIRHFHSRQGDWGDRQLSDAEADDCWGDCQTEGCVAWWFAHGRHHPELRTIAIRVMHLWTSASPAERNWAQHERINTARRSKLGFTKLAQLVEITTDFKLAACAQ